MIYAFKASKRRNNSAYYIITDDMIWHDSFEVTHAIIWIMHYLGVH